MPSRTPDGQQVSAPGLLCGRVVASRLLSSAAGEQTWLGTDLEGARAVIIKGLVADAVGPETSERLLRDVGALRAVTTPECVPFRLANRDARILYLIRDHAPGLSLEARLRNGPLPVRETLGVARGILRALSDAHACGVLHRNLSPSRIFLDDRPDGSIGIAVVDFGLNPIERLSLNLREVPADEVRYLSPELAGLLERGLDASSDLYSLGLVLFEALSGRYPFPGRETGDLLRQQLTSPVPDVRSFGVPVPRALAAVLERLLRKDPRDRYQSAEGVLADIEGIADAVERGDLDPVLPIGRHDLRRALTEPSFVGRHSELRVFDAIVERVAQGQCGVVLVEGESGGGKSRLLDEFAERAAAGVRAVVLRGQGVDQGAQLPFQMFFGIAQGIVDRARVEGGFAPQLQSRLGDAKDALAELLPELEPVLGARRQVALGPEDLGEVRSLRAGAALLDALGTPEHPAIVLLDDCQWADEQSLKLLRYWNQLVRDDAAKHRYVVVVASFRAEEVPESHTLRTLLPVAHLRLNPLGSDDLALLLESMAGALPSQVAEIASRFSEGNPFIASAVLQGLVDSGALKPDASGWGIDEAALAEAQTSRHAALFLARRIQRLPPETLKLLSVAAVLGKRFDVDTAAVLAGVTQVQATAALEEARKRRILWPEGTPGRYAFVHDKLREATLAVLGDDARRPLHHKAAAILEQHQAHVAFDVAFHYDAAGDSVRALPHAIAAAEEARKRHALEVADRNYRIAERGSHDAERATRLRVVLGLGDVLTLRGTYEEAGRWYEEARSLAEDDLGRAEVESKIGELAFKRFDYPTAVEACRRGLNRLGRYVPRSGFMFLALMLWQTAVYTLRSAFPILRPRVRPLGTPRARADLLAVSLYARLLYLYFFAVAGKIPAGWAVLSAVNLAERYPPTGELGHVYSLLANVIGAGFPPLVFWGYFLRERALEIHRRLNNLHGEGQALAYQWVVSAPRGEWADGIERAQRGRKLLALTGDQWDMNAAAWGISFSRYYQGNLSQSLDDAQALFRAARQIGDLQYMGNAVWWWAQASGGQVPRELIDSMLTRPNLFLSTRISLLAAQGLRCMVDGEPEKAAASLGEARRLALRTGMIDSLISSVVAWEATALRFAAERTALIDVERRRALLKRASAAARRARWTHAIFKVARAHALRESALVAALRGHRKRAMRFLQQSLDDAEEMNMAYERALTLEARGRIGTVFGWDGAAEDTDAARQVLAQLSPVPSAAPPIDSATRPTLSVVERFSTVLDKGRAIATSLTRDAVFSSAEDAARTLLRGERCAVLERDPGGDGRALKRSAGGTGLECMALAQRALSSRAPAIFSVDAAREGDEPLVLAGVKSALAAPILVRGEPVAVLCVTHTQLAGLFGEEETRLAGFVSTLAGAALENAEGFAKVEEALRLRDEFLSVASHELKTPLTPLSLKIASLARAAEAVPDSDLASSVQRHVDVMRRQVARLADLVSNLLDVSRISGGRLSLVFEDIDLAAVATDVTSQFEPQAEKAGCQLELKAEQPAVAHGDRPRLEQVLANLLSNAIKYGPGKPILVEVSQDDTHVRLSVRDEGIGIEPDVLPRIFEKFGRGVSDRHYGGLGLGLYVTRQLVQAMGGTVNADSIPGRGATFTVELPKDNTAYRDRANAQEVAG